MPANRDRIEVEFTLPAEEQEPEPVAEDAPTETADAEPGPPAQQPPDFTFTLPEAEEESVREAASATAASFNGDRPNGAQGSEDEEPVVDVVEHVERILKVKRWEKRDKPFRGFDSPPGRF